MKTKLMQIALVAVLVPILSSCGAILPSMLLGSNDPFSEAYFNNLVASGMSASNASYVSGYSGSSSSSASSKLSFSKVSAQKSYVGSMSASSASDKAKDSVAQSLSAVSDNSHFASVS